MQIADGADSLPQEPGWAQVTGKAQNPLPHTFPLLPAVLSLSCPPLASSTPRLRGEVIPVAEEQPLPKHSQCRKGEMASPNPALQGQQRLRGTLYPTTPQSAFSSETSPFHLLLCGFTGLPVLKLATLPCPTLETLHS